MSGVTFNVGAGQDKCRRDSGEGGPDPGTKNPRLQGNERAPMCRPKRPISIVEWRMGGGAGRPCKRCRRAAWPALYKGSGAGATHQRTSPVERKSTSSYTAPGSCLPAHGTALEGLGHRRCDEHQAPTIAGKDGTEPLTKQTRTTQARHFVKIAPPSQGLIPPC